MIYCDITYFVKSHWNLHLKFSLFVLGISNANFSNVDIPHVTLSPQIWNHITLSTQIWNLETVKSSLQVFAVCLCPLNLTFRMLTFRMLTFRMLTFPMLFCHKALLLSKTKCAVLKYEMCRFQRGSEFSNYEIELRNPVTQNDVTLRVTNSNIFTQVLLSNY